MLNAFRLVEGDGLVAMYYFEPPIRSLAVYWGFIIFRWAFSSVKGWAERIRQVDAFQPNRRSARGRQGHDRVGGFDEGVFKDVPSVSLSVCMSELEQGCGVRDRCVSRCPPPPPVGRRM